MVNNGYYSNSQPYRAGDIRREREIGDWGRASEHIGHRWEELGYQRLVPLLDGSWPSAEYQPVGALPVMSLPSVQASVTSLGLPSPDVVVLMSSARGYALQPVDFKWDLEFASYDQIRASTLDALLSRDSGVLREALERVAGRGLSDAACVDGLLFVPDRPANRLYLNSNANRRREYPVEQAEVVFASVTAQEFFSRLPGWAMAEHLAQRERSRKTLDYLEAAERYYRLGAGLLGAIARLSASVFDPDPQQPDASSAMAWLECSLRTRSASLTVMVSQVEQMMELRARQVRRLKQLTKSPCRPADIFRVLSRRGIKVRAGDPEGDAGWRDVLRRVAAEHRGAVHRAGLALVQGGLDDDAAIARLEADLPKLQAKARAQAARILAGLIGSVGT